MNDTDFRDRTHQLIGSLEAALGGLKSLPFINIHMVAGRSDDIDAALQGQFRIRERRFPLVPPVDWSDEPYRSQGERGFFQNSFVFADPLLRDERFPEVLSPLAAIVADWMSANPRVDPPSPHRYAWHDHAAAGRLVVMTFVLREGMRHGRLGADLATTLAAASLEHVDYLLADEHHAAHSNHGLFSDAALAIAARSLAPFPEARHWVEVGERRLADVLRHTIDDVDSVHLEHSPYYHWIVHSALARFAASDLFEGLDLASLTSRMEESGAWLVAPDGTLPPIGDTPAGRYPPDSVHAPQGMRIFSEAGYAVVRDQNSALFITAAHHPTAHKHSDDGSFCLYEDGQPLVLDSGDPGYDYESSERRYGTSPVAHSTICVDGFAWAETSPPYGSGVLDSAEAPGVYAVLTKNPGALPNGGVARRLTIYSPRHFLIVIDDVEAQDGLNLVQHLPLAPDLGATVTPHDDVQIHRDARLVASLAPFSVAEAQQGGIAIARGCRLPCLAGFTFPSTESAQPRCDIALSAPTGHPRAFALMIGPNATPHPTLRWTSMGTTTRCEISGMSATGIKMRIVNETLEFEAGDE